MAPLPPPHQPARRCSHHQRRSVRATGSAGRILSRTRKAPSRSWIAESMDAWTCRPSPSCRVVTRSNGMLRRATGFTAMANSDMDGGVPSDLRAQGRQVSEGSAGRGVGAPGAAGSVLPGGPPARRNTDMRAAMNTTFSPQPDAPSVRQRQAGGRIWVAQREPLAPRVARSAQPACH